MLNYAFLLFGSAFWGKFIEKFIFGHQKDYRRNEHRKTQKVRFPYKV